MEKETEKKSTRNIARLLLFAAGTFFVTLAVVGIFIPILPTTPFLLLAAACYARSSQRFYNWLFTNRWFGSYLTNYHRKKALPRRTKIQAIAVLWLAIAISGFVVDSLIIRLLLAAVAIGVSIHIFSLRTLKDQKS
ncbi:MAG: YbaN family protein [Chloroflexi bacterium]|nr:YbaN family protein [Chloroflexota bacterium]